ncbi:MAG: TetR/AcrR family transcriptional regulator [Bosea sp.]|uniref:TetR/AcrR family transcriptional regulator n=1 Tax=unclassified Bosea (in: a-proteobacteria) TaxID=2653178 RepID=UPI00096513C4|nr:MULTISPECIES: TetR/AcrR family transcriptional regulator [unclassified Bosea (in: a-proteobacteria)]MBN9455901.1 TetR/AcrR family transcriptional regulator [Bosea sp. (in: a-proteobacteria)]OJV05933.1 MAG: TetR family transcriptional regulator [Bosea sp. 67-29]
MARKPVSSKAEPAASTPEAAKPVDPRKRAVDALMRLAADRPWDEIELPDIAAEAGLTLAQLRGFFPSKLAMLGGVTRIADDAVLAGVSDDLAGEPVRERLFDLVMRRLDALAPYKAGLRRIVPVIRRDPLALAALNRGAVNSWRYLLASVGIPTEDSLGSLRVQGAVLLMARVSDVWLDDDEPELSKTMARLDRELKTAGRIMARVEDVHRLTAPFRGLARAICSGRPLTARRRERASERGEDNDDYAPAI